MIHFEITKSPDLNALTQFKYFHNQIYIGRSSGDILILDPEIQGSHAMLEVIEKELIIHPQKNVTHFLINGKRATGIKKLKINDQIIFGTTNIKILHFEETIRESKKDILNRKLNMAIESSPSTVNVIEYLNKLMKT